MMVNLKIILMLITKCARFKAFASALLSQSYDEDTVTASAGLTIITMGKIVKVWS